MSDYRHRKLGAIPSPKDHRDFHVARFVQVERSFPVEFKVAPLIPEPYDQDDVGACVAYSLKAIKEIQEQKERNTYTRYSAAYIYGAREQKHYRGEGMIPREALEILLKRGVCREQLLPGIYPYPVAATMITEAMHHDAYPQRIKAYAAAYLVEEIKSALMDLGPVMAVIPVYDSFYQGGHLPRPDPIKENMYGFHALVLVGWTKDNRWLALNSWGKDWGELGGYCTLPFDYPFSEIWTITDLVVQPEPKVYEIFVSPWRKGSRRAWLVHMGLFATKEEAVEQVIKPLQDDLARAGQKLKINT
ncbi:MAG TPA: C1 family peptidase [Syntrophothermus lipocalidus]|nr:C1 family peptidase [Syntrophothermus lipocalidus]HOV42859.1 C1 family peptidase [Syntrophothermus lipocalidus]